MRRGFGVHGSLGRSGRHLRCNCVKMSEVSVQPLRILTYVKRDLRENLRGVR